MDPTAPTPGLESTDLASFNRPFNYEEYRAALGGRPTGSGVFYYFEEPLPFIDLRRTCHALVDEYAEADPTYVAKTEALQETYPFFRKVKGDGNCGWRALAFGLFERLQALKDPNRIIQQINRFRRLSRSLEQTGIKKDVYAEFVRPTLILLNQIATKTANGEFHWAGKTLWLEFNTLEFGNAIVMHFRLLASAQLKLFADKYSPFLSDSPDIPTYCAKHIDPFTAELEQLGLQALVDAVFEPAAIALEVLYLDRSEGDEVTRHEGGQGSEGTVRLLYRPGHYDLIYISEDVDILTDAI